MNPTFLEKAREVIPDNATLINLVSRRVRQLNSGVRPLIAMDEDTVSLGYIDVALREIGEGKITAVPAVVAS